MANLDNRMYSILSSLFYLQLLQLMLDQNYSLSTVCFVEKYYSFTILKHPSKF